MRKTKGFKFGHPSHLVVLGTSEKFIDGARRYVIAFEGTYTRVAIAWATKSYAAEATEDPFEFCLKALSCSLKINN